MNPPIQKGERVVVNGNPLPYATAFVAECNYIAPEARWAITLEWPNLPPELGPSPQYSRVYDTDEGKTWYRYAATN